MNPARAAAVPRAVRDQKTENTLQAMYKAMHDVVMATPLPLTALAIGATNDITSGETRPMGVVRLLVLAQLAPEAASAVRRLVDLIIADITPEVRRLLLSMKG